MSNSQNISQKKAILNMLSEGYKPSQIYKLLGYDRSYVYRICRGLSVDSVVQKKRQTCGQSVDKVNVHADRVRFFVHRMGDRYKSHPKSFFKDFLPGVDIQCQGRVIYGRCREKFFGDSEEKALFNSLSFWNRVIVRLESRLGVSIFGRGKPAFEFLYGEYETSPSDLAVDAERRGYRWRVYHSEDGKLRLDVNWSDGVPGHETYHSRDNHVDSITMNRFVNSVLDSPQAPSYGELVKVVKAISDEQLEGAKGLRSLIDLLRPKDSGDVFVDVRELDYFG